MLHYSVKSQVGHSRHTTAATATWLTLGCRDGCSKRMNSTPSNSDDVLWRLSAGVNCTRTVLKDPGKSSFRRVIPYARDGGYGCSRYSYEQVKIAVYENSRRRRDKRNTTFSSSVGWPCDRCTGSMGNAPARRDKRKTDALHRETLPSKALKRYGGQVQWCASSSTFPTEIAQRLMLATINFET